MHPEFKDMDIAAIVKSFLVELFDAKECGRANEWKCLVFDAERGRTWVSNFNPREYVKVIALSEERLFRGMNHSVEVYLYNNYKEKYTRTPVFVYSVQDFLDVVTSSLALGMPYVAITFNISKEWMGLERQTIRNHRYNLRKNTDPLALHAAKEASSRGRNYVYVTQRYRDSFSLVQPPLLK